ncbi:hypothetical protein CP061683_2660, partial [Chlamydia psittaci 06-1683]
MSSEIPHLSENHEFSLQESPSEVIITRFLFKNPTFKKKSRVFSSQIPHFTLKTCVFSSQVLQLS